MFASSSRVRECCEPGRERVKAEAGERDGNAIGASPSRSRENRLRRVRNGRGVLGGHLAHSGLGVARDSRPGDSSRTVLTSIYRRRRAQGDPRPTSSHSRRQRRLQRPHRDRPPRRPRPDHQHVSELRRLRARVVIPRQRTIRLPRRPPHPRPRGTSVRRGHVPRASRSTPMAPTGALRPSRRPPGRTRGRVWRERPSRAFRHRTTPGCSVARGTGDA